MCGQYKKAPHVGNISLFEEIVMNKLTFTFSWTNEKAWSGTPSGLYQALSKRLDLEKLNVAPSNNSFLQKVKSLLFPSAVYKQAERILNSHCHANSNVVYFVFGEYISKSVSNTFCYQDLSVDYMLREMADKDSYYNRISPKIKIPYQFMLRQKRAHANRFYCECAGVFTMSKWLRDDLIEKVGIPPEKVFHVGGGCTPDISLVDITQKRGNKFLFVGKDWTRKNGDLVVRAFEKLQKRHPEMDAQLYVAGPSVAPSILEGKKNIHFLGRLSYDEIVHYYNMCDYFVMPSDFEAYGLVFPEALIFGLPCIGKNCYAMPEFIQDGENGYLIENNDDNELLLAMEKLLIDGKEMAQNVQKQHRHYVETYSWDNVASKIVESMKKCGYTFN